MANQGSSQKKIIFEVGTRLEAQDFTKNWYPARICRIDHSGKKSLIHFEGWNHRFDEWISFDSERLRSSSRNVENKEDKAEKVSQSHQDVYNYMSKDWKFGDRVLAKWNDGKFYPAKITKKNEEGVYEVLFYDGVKKNIQKVNLKPDNRKIQPLPVSKETLTQQSERMQRKTKLANARAERARKRSKEQADNVSSVALGKRKEKNKKQKLESEPVGDKEPSSPSPVDIKKSKIPPVEEDDKEASGISSPNKEIIDSVSQETNTEQSTETNTKKTDVQNISTEKTNMNNTSTENENVENTDKKKEMQDQEMREYREEIETASKKDILKTKSAELLGNEIKNKTSMDKVKESPELDSCSNEQPSVECHEESNEQDDSESTRKPDSPIEIKELPPKDTSPLKPESTENAIAKDSIECSHDKPAKEADNALDKTLPDVVEKKADEVVQLKENNDKVEKEIVLNKPKASDKPQEPHQEELKSSLEKNTEQSVENNKKSDVVQTEEEPKEAENKITTKKTTKVSPKTQKKIKGNQNSTGEKKRATRSRSAISPRGYGYSMAVMHPQVSKPEPTTEEKTASPSNQTTKESIDTIIDSLGEDTAVVELEPDASESNQDTNSEVAPQSKVKTKNFQAKKLRLDQITVKLSAQRQSEAEAAVQSPSAFQMTVQQSPSPPLMPSPPPPPLPPPTVALPTPPPQKAPSPSAPLASHYAMDTFNVPPPLIYAPMAAQCCSNPHCQQHGPVYPTPPRAPLHSGLSHPMHLPPSHLHPHSAGYVMYPPGHGPTYDTRPPMSACSCAGCAGAVYHMPPDASPHHESALARLMQVEQRILHAGPSPHMAHYRDGAPHHGAWIPHGHPHAAQYCPPLPSKHEEIWRHERPPHQSNSPSHVSPVSESEAAIMMRRWKNERSLPPGSSSTTTDLIPGRIDELPGHGKRGTHGESLQRGVPSSAPREPKQQPEKVLKENSKSKEMDKEKSQPTTTQSKVSESSVDQQPNSTCTASNVPSSTVTMPTYSQAMSIGGKTRKGKEPAGPAPKELVIDLDHNKFKCPIAGCDKSFRKESGLDYHMKYYHSPGGKEVKRKRSSASMRSDGTPESSPDVPGPSLTKRRCHRSSAPGQLSSEPGIPPTTSKQDTPSTAALESLAVKVESPAKVAAVTPEAELEIEPGTEADVMYCGSVESIEVEEEDVLNGDVIRCRCEETDEGGFMIQCEQCLTWQHSECVGLTEQTVPSKYLCYVCSNPKGLRRHAKYRNDFDWFRKGSLPSFSFQSDTVDNQGYTNQISLSTHDLMADVHSVDNVLKSLRVKLDILRSPNHPALGMWYKPTIKSDLTDLTPKTPETLDTVKTPIETSLLMVKKDPLSNGLEGTKSSLTDHNQNGIENTDIRNGSTGLLNGEVTSVSSQQGSFNLTLNSRINTEEIEEEEAISPLPPLVPVGGTTRGNSETTALDSTKTNEKGLNNNNNKIDTPKDCGVSVLIADDDTNQPPIRRSSSSCDRSTEDTVDKRDVHLLDPSETKDQVATSHLLDDVAELQDSLESRMDVIERQIQVLEQTTQENYDQSDTTKPDLRKLAKDLNRIKRLALHVG